MCAGVHKSCCFAREPAWSWGSALHWGWGGCVVCRFISGWCLLLPGVRGTIPFRCVGWLCLPIVGHLAPLGLWGGWMKLDLDPRVLGASLCSWVSASAGWDLPLPPSPRGMGDRYVPQELGTHFQLDFVRGCCWFRAPWGLGWMLHWLCNSQEQFHPPPQARRPLAEVLRAPGCSILGALSCRGASLPWKAPGAQDCLPLPSCSKPSSSCVPAWRGAHGGGKKSLPLPLFCLG